MRFKKNQRLLNGMLLNDIKELNRTLKLHGEAHMAQDLLPQFTELVKKVEKLEGVLNFKLNDGPIHNHSVRIAELEKLVALVAHHTNKISDVEECNSAHYERLCDIEEFDKTVLKSIPDIEILKTQVQGLVRDVDALKIQFHNTNLHYNGLITEVLEQKKFLSKVQAVLDRERDARLVNSPSHKKEIAAMRMDATAKKDAKGQSGFSMDKHVDMMVKKGRPRKP